MGRARVVPGTVAVGSVLLAAAACTGAGTASTASSSGGVAASGAPTASTSAPAATVSASRSGGASSPPSETAAPSVAVSSAPPVPVGKPATLRTGVLVTVSPPQPVQVTGHGPGELSGPGIAVTVRVQNAASGAFDLDGIAVNATYGAGSGTPAAPSNSSPARPLQGSLAAGASATGSYVFLVPASARPGVRIDVSSSSAARILVFRS